MPNRASAPPGF